MKMASTWNIGAPNSIARYAANTSWGANDWAVFEYVKGMPVVRAAGSLEHCKHFVADDRILVDVRGYKKLADS